ncbi:MAG TPA: hypothetical protein VFS93_03430 [Terrimesophilobacter sp.]|nr:hypothetical protein [Terrimesophilobacter sp.]
MSAVSHQNMSDERMLEATGRVRADWHALLDAAGARDWAHPQIARWLVEEHGVDGWWAQGVTVGFEQAIGRRLPGQRADGTFEVSVTKTLGAARKAVRDQVIAILVEQLGEPASLSPDSLYSTARWKIAGETVVAAISEPKPGKTLVALTRSRILDGETLDAAKSELRGILGRLGPSGGA